MKIKIEGSMIIEHVLEICKLSKTTGDIEKKMIICIKLNGIVKHYFGNKFHKQQEFNYIP